MILKQVDQYAAFLMVQAVVWVVNELADIASYFIKFGNESLEHAPYVSLLEHYFCSVLKRISFEILIEINSQKKMSVLYGCDTLIYRFEIMALMENWELTRIFRSRR